MITTANNVHARILVDEKGDFQKLNLLNECTKEYSSIRSPGIHKIICPIYPPAAVTLHLCSEGFFLRLNADLTPVYPLLPFPVNLILYSKYFFIPICNCTNNHKPVNNIHNSFSLLHKWMNTCNQKTISPFHIRCTS